MTGPSNPSTICTKLQRVATLSRQRPQMVWNTLAHHIDAELLGMALQRVRKDAAPGIDGVTVAQYADKQEENLPRLLAAFKSGSYRAPPVRRVYVPKDNGQQRPIGIPTVEDKVLQRAVAMVLNAVYEQDFLACSYGFRPGRSPHQALDALYQELARMQGGIVIELDIVSFFDAMSHTVLQDFLDKRIRDGVLRRAISKWLKAGVLEDGQVHYSEQGSPQGGVISPMLANIYLHEVLDLWFEHDVKPRMRGRCTMVRYADDAVLVCEDESDARRIMDVLPKRFGRFGLKLHPEKTRMVDFKKPQRRGRGAEGTSRRRPESFEFLGFTYYWGKSRQGYCVVRRKTSRKRLGRAIRRIGEWCARNRHRPLREQRHELNSKLRGHYGYYGVIGNLRSLRQFQHAVGQCWFKWLGRRSQKAKMSWKDFERLLQHHPLLNPPAPYASVARP